MDRLLGAASAAMAAAAGERAAPTRVIAIVQAAGRQVGIAGEHVVQAVVVPPDMAAVPRRAGGLVGVIARGDQLLPVVRLENWLDAVEDEGEGAAPDPAAIASSPDARIVILNDGERVVGLLVDAVVGMQRCAPDAVARLFHDDRPDELFAGAVRLDGHAAPLALLEPARLAAIAGTWCAAAGVERAAARGAHVTGGTASDAATRRTSLGVFRIGDVLVGLDVADIGELVATPALRPPPLRHPSSRGLCDWRGRLLPVVDIGGLLGALPGAGSPAWLCIVRHGDLVLGVLVHEIVALHAADVPVGADAAAGTQLVRRELTTPHGILQLLDTAALMTRCPESGISLRGQAVARQDAAATSPHTWLVFEAGGSYATRIDCVQEIVPLPSALRPRLEAGLPVSLQWRGDAIPVRSLFVDPAQSVAPRDARLLVVVVADGGRIAIPIAGVKAMIAPRTSTLARLRVRAELVDVISTAAGADRASYEVVDLEARASSEQGPRRAA